MRVLHLATLPFEATEGIARACRETARALEGVESYLAVDREPDASVDGFAGVRVVPAWAPTIPWRRQFIEAIRELEPDVVHFHGGTLAPALAYAPSLRGRAVVVSCYRTARFDRETGLHVREGRANVSAIRAGATHAGGVAVARRALRSGRVGVLCTADPHIEEMFATAGPVIRVQGAARLSDQRAMWNEHPTAVFAGRAHEARGIDDLIAAFPEVLRTIPNARLRLALLPTADATRYRDQLAGQEWARVDIGASADLDSVLADCQVGAFPFRASTTLTPALTAAEAMAVGLPIVAGAVDCLAALVEPGRNGELVAPGDVDGLAAALARVLTGPSTWEPLSEGARKTIEESWSWRRAAEVTWDAYTIAIARTRTNARRAQ